MCHYEQVKTGAVIQFPASARFWMKIAYVDGSIAGVVDLTNGKYIPAYDFHTYGLDENSVTVVSDNLDDFIMND